MRYYFGPWVGAPFAYASARVIECVYSSRANYCPLEGVIVPSWH